MIPLLTAAQLREADRRTMAEQGITSLELMERAAQACADHLLGRFEASVPFVVLAGMGNNGGDGLAIARLLQAAGRSVRVFVLAYRPEGSADHKAQAEQALAAGVPVVHWGKEEALPELLDREVVIDALFGIGLDRPLDGPVARLIHDLNAKPNTVVAIDLPSGLPADGGSETPVALEADLTLTFEVPKPVFLLPGSERYTGRVRVLSIGLSPAYLAEVADQVLVEPADVARLMPDRPLWGHKGTFGHAGLLAGGRGSMGAALLAGRACLRSGPGLITLFAPAGNEVLVHQVAPELLVRTDPSPDRLEQLPDLGRCTAVGIGPGIGTDEGTARLVKLLIQQATAPLVFDADAINILGANRTWLAFLPPGSILTPHPKEFDRLTETSASAVERLAKAREMAMRRNVIVVLKGHRTAVCSPSGTVYFNPTGNPGMAKGGSGDALTGILTGVLAQGLPSLEAALLGVYAHGAAGDIAAAEVGMDGMSVSDLIERLPKAWEQLRALA